jgi:hypothetical protein
MPSPTRKNAAAAAAAKNRTRKNANAFMANMMSGKPWANVVEEYEAAMPKRRAKAPSPPSPPTMENDALEDYRVPDLRLRKGIWENFPVDLKAIPSANGTERYAITWNGEKLRAWRDERSESWNEYQDYKDWQTIRLLHALEKHSHKYTVEAPRSDREIAVIAMVHEAAAARPAAVAAARRSRSRSPSRAAAARRRSRSRSRSRSPARAAAARPKSRSRSPVRAAAAHSGPVLKKLNDITTYFPGVVVWKSVAGRAGESTYALTVRGDFQRRVAPAEARRTLDALMAALRASTFWHVLAPVGDEFVRLEMRHD